MPGTRIVAPQHRLFGQPENIRDGICAGRSRLRPRTGARDESTESDQRHYPASPRYGGPAGMARPFLQGLIGHPASFHALDTGYARWVRRNPNLRGLGAAARPIAPPDLCDRAGDELLEHRRVEISQLLEVQTRLADIVLAKLGQ